MEILERAVPSLVHSDHGGFVKSYIASSTRLFHLMRRAATLQHPAIMLSLVAEKAFDTIKWPYSVFYIESVIFLTIFCVKTT